MLWHTSTMMGCAMRGSDGEVGAVSDLLFDDTTWRLRWIVVNTRHWFPSHEVLLPAAAEAHQSSPPVDLPDEARCQKDLVAGSPPPGVDPDIANDPDASRRCLVED
jgi:hypothetical protein